MSIQTWTCATCTDNGRKGYCAFGVPMAVSKRTPDRPPRGKNRGGVR